MNNKISILTGSFLACLMLLSCENESRLNEIKKDLGSVKSIGVTNEEVRDKVSLSAPSLNKPTPPPTEDYSYDGYYGDGGYYGDDYNYNYDIPEYEYYPGD
jgi:hypothetical protein